MNRFTLAFLIIYFLLPFSKTYGQADSMYITAIRKADAAYGFKWLHNENKPEDKQTTDRD